MGKNGKDFAEAYGTLMHEAVYLVTLDAAIEKAVLEHNKPKTVR